MHILILGAAGMVGRKLTERLLRDGRLGKHDITRHDAAGRGGARQAREASIPIEVVASDFADAGAAEPLIAGRPDVIFHLAAIVSGEAEARIRQGLPDQSRRHADLIDAIRHAGGGYKPRLVFTSSIAVFGAPFPEKIGDEFFHTPLTSYGTQKSICELLINDYTRKGLLDGICIRLPTICVRPGKPNKAASGFFSNIIREPLAGEEAVLPVSEDVRHWHASPKSAVGFLVHAGTMDLNAMGPRRNLSMPGMSVTVGEQIAALERVAGKNVTARIKRVPDPTIIGIVSGWPRDFVTDRALKLGFTTAEKTFDDIIRIHIEDELGGKFAG